MAEPRPREFIPVRIALLAGSETRPRENDVPGDNREAAGREAGGVVAPAPAEVTDIGYFAPPALPTPFPRIHHQLIVAALAGVGGSVARSSDLIWPFPSEMSRAEIYALRDQSGLPRDGFFQQYFDQQPEIHDILEVGDAP